MDAGAGPCGTLARNGRHRSGMPMASSITWMLVNLWPQLVDYYATRPPNPFMKLGAKCGGGNGKVELW